jgi:hypothetical protein
MRKVTVALATAIAALAAAGHAHAATPQTYTDPAGDSGTAPDVTQISVGNDQTGRYEFDVSFASDYGANAQFYLYLDTDQNTSTGDPDMEGADYVVYDDHASHSFELDSWNGSDWTLAAFTTAALTIGQDSRSLQFTINRSELADSTAFDFFVYAVDGASTDNATSYDDAPSGNGSFTYSYQQDKLTLAFVTTKSIVKGRTWTVISTIRRSDTQTLQGSDGTIGCHSKLPVLLHAWVSPGGTVGSAAVCEFLLPKQKHKKKAVAVSATVTIAAGGATTKKTVTTKA